LWKNIGEKIGGSRARQGILRIDIKNIKGKIEQLNFVKIKYFWSVKQTIKKFKSQATGRKYLQTTYLTKD
jgi:hypothetical protein